MTIPLRPQGPLGEEDPLSWMLFPPHPGTDLHTAPETRSFPLLNVGTLFLFPTFTPGCRGQRWTVQTCLTCHRSQRFLNNPEHLLWGDRPEAQLGSQAGERW
ncbi:hypothetical protein HPG69_008897 [Diceros bicornis minor]|uniref:Uncharacterized protein n=1 Tax=Diceros bicornis minor TaxID=77932 RepID=A0A7J7FAX8_DICBM|nr:hypothetical protein HPG69_008897 [Diceros bicornis minor]